MITIRLRRDISTEWRRVDPILQDGEPGYEEDTKKLKIGNGISRWSSLTYVSSPLSIPEGSDDAVTLQMLNDHINSQNPHPVYDDGPSLLLLYQNAKV